jgi:hypothetical protein
VTVSELQSGIVAIEVYMKFERVSCCRALKPAGRPLPHCRGGNGPPSATRRLRGGGAVVDSKNIVCHVNSSACRVYVNSQVHFRGHFRVHFRTSTPTFICGRTATSLFYTYTRLLMYSGLYSATATFSRSFSCTFSYIHAYIHLWKHSDVSILHLHSPVPVAVQRSLQCYSYIFAAIFVYIFVHPCLHSSVDAHVCVTYILRFSGPSLALFSRWQRVHGYTSLIRPRFHSSLHSTSTFSEHIRDPGVYKCSTFYIYILRTFSFI